MLNHDTPSSLQYRDDYDTPASLVQALKHGPIAKVLRSTATTLALCFKVPFLSPCNSTQPTRLSAAREVQNWFSLVTDMLANLTSTAESQSLPLTFLLDGGGNPGQFPCLANAWRPLQSVFISQRDPAGAFTQNNASLGWDRLVVLNEPQNLWASAVQRDFGKFKLLDYPYLVWEPSDQASIVEDAQAYVKADQAHPAGMRFAINIDPLQLKTFAAPVSRNAWEAQLPGTRAGDGAALATVFRPDGALFVVFQRPDSLSGAPQLVAMAVSLQPETRTVAVLSPAKALTSVPEPVLHTHSSGAYSVSVWSASGSTLIYTVLQLDQVGRVLGSTALHADLPQSAIGALPSNVAVLQQTASSATLAFASTDPSVCSVLTARLTISTAHLTVGPQSCALLPANVTGDIQGVFIVPEGENSAAEPFLALHIGQNLFAGRRHAVGVPGQPTWLAAGSAVRAAGSGSQVFAAIQDAYCPNNEHANKQVTPSSCKQTPFSIQGVLGYAFGEAAAWDAAVAAAVPAPPPQWLGQSNPPHNAAFPGQALWHCSADLMHGAFAQGVDASVVCGLDAVAKAVAASGQGGQRALGPPCAVLRSGRNTSCPLCGAAVPVEGVWLTTFW